MFAVLYFSFLIKVDDLCFQVEQNKTTVFCVACLYATLELFIYL